MKSLIRLNDYSKEDIFEIFKIADDIRTGRYHGFLNGKTIIMFFPETSIRTRATFERGIYLLGGQSIIFSPETLDKKEKISDVIGYLNNWASTIIVRYKDIQMLDEMNLASNIPIINAMTDVNHPCEIIADLYSLSKIRKNFLADNYLFCGTSGNIGLAWREAAQVMSLQLSQCCKEKYRMPNVNYYDDIHNAVTGKDIICTDSIPHSYLDDFKDYKITLDIMKQANEGAILNPCPPFYRDEELTDEVIESNYFVGYGFKKYLLEIQQAIIIYNLSI